MHSFHLLLVDDHENIHFDGVDALHVNKYLDLYGGVVRGANVGLLYDPNGNRGRLGQAAGPSAHSSRVAL